MARKAALVGRTGDHRLRTPGPDLLAADPGEHLGALAAIGAVSLKAGQALAVVGVILGIVGQGPDPHQVQHLDRGVARQGLEGVELVAGRVDAAHVFASFDTPACCGLLRMTNLGEIHKPSSC
jgi:hypothetical protein